MQVIADPGELKALRQTWVADRVAFVPTMGALHGGHLSLFQAARSLGSRFVVSIYVNPLQFGPSEDFDRYPRSLEADLAHCEAAGADVVFVPEPPMLHPDGYETLTQVVPPPTLVNQLCGLSRPGLFTGVATIVLKLFQIVSPDYAVFGEKDAQQLKVIERMIRDLDLPVTLVGAPTVREPDGLAMSSRNAYLTTDSARQQARLLSRLLSAVQQLYMQGMVTAEETLALAQERVLEETLYPDFRLEYLAAVDSHRFLPVDLLEDTTRILAAAHVGSVRLIDNAMMTEVLGMPSTSPRILTAAQA